MRDEKFLSFDLSFSLSSRTSENARTFTSDLENERQNLSIDSKKQKRRQKFVCSKDCLFCSKNTKKFRSCFDQKFKKTANEFYRTDREKTTKKVYEDEEVRWEGTRRIITLLR